MHDFIRLLELRDGARPERRPGELDPAQCPPALISCFHALEDRQTIRAFFLQQLRPGDKGARR
jgi:hypothetical protein